MYGYDDLTVIFNDYIGYQIEWEVMQVIKLICNLIVK